MALGEKESFGIDPAIARSAQGPLGPNGDRDTQWVQGILLRFTVRYGATLTLLCWNEMGR